MDELEFNIKISDLLDEWAEKRNAQKKRELERKEGEVD